MMTTLHPHQPIAQEPAWEVCRAAPVVSAAETRKQDITATVAHAWEQQAAPANMWRTKVQAGTR